MNHCGKQYVVENGKWFYIYITGVGYHCLGSVCYLPLVAKVIIKLSVSVYLNPTNKLSDAQNSSEN